MAPVHIGDDAHGTQLQVARQVAADGEGAYELPVWLQPELGAMAFSKAIDSSDGRGRRRRGLPTDVKPGQHWVMQRRAEGGYKLFPVTGWYEFGKPIHAPPALVATPPAPVSTSAPGKRKAALLAASVAAASPAERGEAELKREAGVRKALADKWDSFMERRSKRENLGGSRKVQEDSNGYKLPTQEERTTDDTGMRNIVQKHRKARQKQARATEAGAEDEDAPDTANALHDLKRGSDNAWDFSDNEQFSDDDEGYKVEYDDQHKADEDDAPSADEAQAEEGKTGEVAIGEALGDVGLQIEAALHRVQEAAASKPAPPAAETLAAPAGPAAPAAAAAAVEAPLPTAPARRETVVRCLRFYGGSCTLKQVAQTLDLRRSQVALWNAYTATIKEVAVIIKVPDGKPLLKLKAAYAVEEHA